MVSVPSFVAGLRLADDDALNFLVQLLLGVKSGITALAGGGQAGATQLSYGTNEVSTVASGNDSVMLPPAIPGVTVTVINDTATSMQVYGSNQVVNGVALTDTIAPNNSQNQAAAATGVAQAGTKAASYECFTAGKWKQLLSN